jgi:undecaprenyl pyrophosphate synthase
MTTKNKNKTNMTNKNKNTKIVVKSISVTDAIDEIIALVDDLASQTQAGDMSPNDISDRLYEISDDLGDLANAI